MNILVVSNTPWSDENSFGNSFSNIFSGIPDLRFANIYCRPGKPHNQLEMECFQITEKSLFRNLKNRNIPSGIRIEAKKQDDVVQTPISGFDQARKMRWQIMFWSRDLIWKMGRWWSDDLKRFIDDFKPDLIFQPVYYSNYLTEIVLRIKAYTQKPMLGYISDDCYTLKQYELSPLYWIDRLHKRKKVKAVIEQCEILYVISQIQKEEYEKIFNPECKILTKCADFSQAAPEYALPKMPVTLLYAGNIGTGRWKSLALIANAIEKVNKNGNYVRMNVYSPTPQTKNMQRALNRNGCRLHGPISLAEVQKLQREADIVVHVEGLSKKSRMAVHQSFSTKLVDYFAMGKCIIAIGAGDEASIKHLEDNDAAIVCGSQKEVDYQLEQLIRKPEMILHYGKKAYECGAKHHDKTRMQTMLLKDMWSVMEEYQ